MPIAFTSLTTQLKRTLQIAPVLHNARRVLSSTKFELKEALKYDNGSKKVKDTNFQHETATSRYRFIYPEFLPDPNPTYRNALREKLERMDMLSRRSVIDIPEFYVGSILSVTYSEPHAPKKTNKFVGICIQRKGCGLRASFLLRNAIDNQGVEVLFEMYDPSIQKIECLRLEKRLDNELLYLRDAPIEYSTFPFDLDAKILPEGTPVPVNDIKVPLKPPPWLVKWEQQGMKGIQEIKVNERKQKKAAKNAKPWEKYDLMKIYRETIPEEEQREIFTAIETELQQLEVTRRELKRKRGFVLSKKTS